MPRPPAWCDSSLRGAGRTRATIVQIEPDGGPFRGALSRQIIHDLLTFKDYVEHAANESVSDRRSQRGHGPS